MRKRLFAALMILSVLLSASPAALASEAAEDNEDDLFAALFEDLHMVILTDGFLGSSAVLDGQDYTFQVEDNSFDYTIMAYMDGEDVQAVDNGDGSFTIRNVTGTLLIGARKTPKIPTEPAPAPTPVKPQPAPVPTPTPQPVQPQPVPEMPVEEPEVIPEEPVEEVLPEAPKPIKPESEKEKPVKPAAPAEPAPEVVEEKEPFPWWIPVLAVLGLGMIAAIILLLSRRTVMFAVDGGTAISAQKILKGHTAARPREPEKTGSVFAGWFTDEARTKRWDFENAKVENHMVLYAKWLAA